MALRSATAPDLTYDVADTEPGDQIKFGDPDTILDNQDWCTQRTSILATDCFYPRTMSGAAWVTLASYTVVLGTQADYVGAAASTATWRQGALCWTDDGATTFDIRFNTAGGNDTLTVVGSTTPTWRQIAVVNSAWDIRDATPNTLFVQARVTAGAGNVYLAGYGMML